MIYTIYGRPKTGKTTLALQGSVPEKTLVLDADRGLIGSDTSGMTIITDLSGTNLNKTVMKDSFISKFDRIIIDTATQLYDDMLHEISGDRTPTLNARGIANNAFAQLLRWLRSEDKEIIVLCQEKIVAPTEDWASADDEEDSVASVTVDLPNGPTKTLTTMSDVIGRLYMANVNDRNVRRLWLAPTPSIVAGARSQKYRERPPFLTKPTIERLNKLLGWN